MKKLKKSLRPSWDEYFLGIVKEVAKRATCNRGRNGCVIVKDKRILTTGYVGSPPGLPHCDEVGHMLREVITPEGEKTKHCIRTSHAEMNALLQAAKFGISLEGATLYSKMVPCFTCSKAIVTVGIKRVVCQKRYHADKESIELFKEAKVKLEVLKDEVEEYENM